MLDGLEGIINIDNQVESQFAKVRDSQNRANTNTRIYHLMTELLDAGASVAEASVIVGKEVGFTSRTIRNKWPELQKGFKSAPPPMAGKATSPSREDNDHGRTFAHTTKDEVKDRRQFEFIVKAMAEDFDTAVSLIGKERIQEVFSKIEL